MPHDTPLITTIVVAFVLAFIFGSIANRLRLPPLIGYLFAGILVGPSSPGFVADISIANQLAEIGVILLMFGVGLHFSLKDLMTVKTLAIPGALVQIAFATLLGVGLALLLGWGVGAGIVLGLALSVASTVVLLKTMQDRRLIDTERGKLAIGWLIVEDLAMILALVLIPALAPILGGDTAPVPHDSFVSLAERLTGADIGVVGIIAITIIKVAAFVGFMLVVGRRVIPWMLHAVAHTGNRELFRLAVLAIALGVALGAAYLFGVSLALGAFFAGMILSESELSQRAANETLPLRDAFAVLFFVSVGMLVDPMVIIENPLPVLGALFIILIGKSVAAFLIVLAFRRPVSTALTISASLAQIGEFSFILAAMGVSLHILPEEGRDLILAGAMISIILNPLMFFIADRLRPRLEARAALRRGEPAGVEPVVSAPVEPSLEPTTEASASVAAEEPVIAPEPDDVPTPTTLSGHTILVGFGRVGSVIGEGLKADGEPFLVIEDSDSRIAEARALAIEVVVGNAASPEVLALANVEGARRLVIAMRNSFEAGQAVEQCRKLNAGIDIVVRAHSHEEQEYLTRMGANTVMMGEREIGLGMLAFLEGKRPEEAGPVTPEEPETSGPKLAPVENFLTKAIEPTLAGAAVAAPAAIAVTEETLVDLPAQSVEPEPVAAEPSVGEALAVEPALEEAASPSLQEPVIVAPSPQEPESDVPEVIILGPPGDPAEPVPPPETPPEPKPEPSPEPLPVPPAPEPEPTPEPVPPPSPEPTPAPEPVKPPEEVPVPAPTEIPQPPAELPTVPPAESEPTPVELPSVDPSPQELPGNNPAEMEAQEREAQAQAPETEQEEGEPGPGEEKQDDESSRTP